MRVGHIIIEYYAELFIPEDKFTVLNKNNVEWFPVLNREKANDGWVWFSNPKDYHRSKKLLKQNNR